MYKEFKPLFLYCETALHAGAGAGVGRVDLPIQREGHTGFPKIESSGLKGSLREFFEEKLPKIKNADGKEEENPVVKNLFGPAADKGDNIGMLGLTDARLLLFPMRSAKGIYAYVTCPAVLTQLEKDMQMANTPITISGLDSFSEKQVLTSGNLLLLDAKIMLEEFVFENVNQSITINTINLATWIAAKYFDINNPFYKAMESKLVIVHDNVFAKFVQLYTEVVTRNRIDNETGTVIDGALFTEEYLPCNSALYTIAMTGNTTQNNGTSEMTKFTNTLVNQSYFQAGGGATIGKGIMKVTY
jgi:CRISPR-associated protein Cmr4